jgi:Arc/MetJ-type ribon-helix-helix transcriptional regulator
MSTITITLPDEIKVFVERQSVREGYESVSAYIDDMIRTLHGMNGLTLEDIKEMEPNADEIAALENPETLADLEAKLLEGLHSPGLVVDRSYWEARKQALRDKYPHIDFDSDM